MNIEKLISEGQGTIVDVRTGAEFAGANAMGSVNVPLNEIPYRMEDLKSLKSPLILCCASGNRSSQAEMYLKQSGIECVNAGSWLNVNYYQSLTLND